MPNRIFKSVLIRRKLGEQCLVLVCGSWWNILEDFGWLGKLCAGKSCLECGENLDKKGDVSCATVSRLGCN